MKSNYEIALHKAFDEVRGRDKDSLLALGASGAGGGAVELPVLNGRFLVDIAGRRVSRDDGAPVEIGWQILALHYLLAAPPSRESGGWTGYSEILEVRGYLGVYEKRVIERLCATAGRDRETFVRASLAVGGERAEWGDEGFRYRVFPLLPVIIAWYAGDDELPPGASFLYPDNVLSILCAEDMVALAESLVGRLKYESSKEAG